MSNPNTRLSYDRANVHLAAYLVDNGLEDAIKESHRQLFQSADIKDKRKATTARTRRFFRKAVMQALSSGVPFDLSKISHQIFSQYVVSCVDNREFMSCSQYNSN